MLLNLIVKMGTGVSNIVTPLAATHYSNLQVTKTTAASKVMMMDTPVPI